MHPRQFNDLLGIARYVALPRGFQPSPPPSLFLTARLGLAAAEARHEIEGEAA